MSMMDGNRECGIRHKFVVKHRDTVPNAYPEMMAELLHWCTVFDAEGMAPVEGGASAGNLSFRTPSGFVITPTRSRLKSGMDWRSLVEVVRSNWIDYEVQVLGHLAPSSDSFLHERIYALRPDVLAVFHGHDAHILRHADRLATEFPMALTAEARLFGTKDDAADTARELAHHAYIIRKGHGFVAVGRTLSQAGSLALQIHRRAAALG